MDGCSAISGIVRGGRGIIWELMPGHSGLVRKVATELPSCSGWRDFWRRFVVVMILYVVFGVI